MKLKISMVDVACALIGIGLAGSMFILVWAVAHPR
jgi:hypothetical protein